MNPVGNVYCDKCNARLVPMTVAPQEEREEHKPAPIKGFSLPTIPLEGQEEQQATGAAAEVGMEEGAESWLSQLRALAVEEPEEPEPVVELRDLGAEGAEDWLSQLRASAVEEAEEFEPVAEPVEPVEIPDWLRDMGPVGEEGELAPAAPEAAPPAFETEPLAPALAEVPDWLREVAPPEAAVPEVAPAVIETEPPAPALAEVPDWLQEIAPPEAAAPEVAPAAFETEPPPPAPIKVPDWLREVAPSEAAAPEVAPAVFETEPPPPAPAEVPDWLREVAPPEAAAPEIAPAVIETEPPAPAPAEVPDWLQEIAPPEAAEPAPEEAVAPFVSAAPPAVSEAPEWLTELQPAPPADTAVPVFEGPLPPAPGIETAEAAGLARAEIPAWLEAMRPREEAAEAAAADESVETEGLLEGLRGVLPLAAAIEMPVAREGALPAEVREASLARAQLLQSLLSRPAEALRPEIHKPGVAISEQLQRLVVGVVLLTSVLAVLAWRPLLGSEAPLLARPARLSREGEALYSTIEGLSAGDSVLVAFEYGPAEADELDAVAEPILHHLVDRETDISIVSTRPEGLAVAARVWDDTWAEILDTTAPEKELIQYYEPDGDYRPGDATGVSRLLADADTRPSLILVLAARPASLRWWVEQVHARYEAAPPVVAGVSAAVEAAASPYLDANAEQLQGTISGLSGAAAYENHRGTGGQTAKRLNAMAAGHVAIVILMLVGAVIHTLIRPRTEAW